MSKNQNFVYLDENFIRFRDEIFIRATAFVSQDCRSFVSLTLLGKSHCWSFCTWRNSCGDVTTVYLESKSSWFIPCLLWRLSWPASIKLSLWNRFGFYSILVLSRQLDVFVDHFRLIFYRCLFSGRSSRVHRHGRGNFLKSFVNCEKFQLIRCHFANNQINALCVLRF